jgi:cell fate (sporulation/competence/biofilm development) regulator YmcA (YheA/YmcA/DUF963 family)
MENKNREEIIKKVSELVEIIKESNDYKKYSELKDKMKNNKDIMDLVNKIKKEEQQLVNKKYRKEDTKELEDSIDKNKKELMSYPIYQEYSYLQEDLNNTFQNIKSIIENSINKV